MSDERIEKSVRDGTSMADATAPPDVAPQCVRCEYDLRGLEPVGRCPECGLDIEVSIARERLALLEPTWIGHLVAGTRSLGFLGRWGSFLCIAFISLGGLFRSLRAFFWLVACVALVLPVAYATWQFSTPPNLRVFSRGIMLACRTAHWMIVGVVVGSIMVGVVVLANAPKWLIITTIAIGSPIGLVGTVGGVAFGIYCKRLAEVFLNDFAAVHASKYLWIFICGCILTGPSLIILAFTANVTSLCAFIPGICCQLGGGVLILALPSYLAKQLRELQNEAAERWRGLDQASSHGLGT